MTKNKINKIKFRGETFTDNAKHGEFIFREIDGILTIQIPKNGLAIIGGGTMEEFVTANAEAARIRLETADLLTAITVGQLISPGVITYSGAILRFIGEQIIEELSGIPLFPDIVDILKKKFKKKAQREIVEETLENGIPDNARRVVDYAKEHNGAAQKGYKGNKKFENDGRNGSEILPEFDASGNPICIRNMM